MIYRDFVEKLNNFSYFKTEMLNTLRGDERTLKNQLVHWRRQGKVHLLKRGIYTLNDRERRAPLTPYMISNILYPPSYVSLESALVSWGLIPERLGEITAVSSRKTAQFRNFYGLFRYRSLQAGRFFGFEWVKEAGELSVLMAGPEKAILDKIYFDPTFRPKADYFLENLRLQNYERLSRRRLLQFAKRFNSPKVRTGAEILARLIREEKE